MVSGKSPDLLPPGWKEQIKVKNGRRIKCYIDPLTGRKFYSKPEVSEYLRTLKHESCTSQQNKMGNDSFSDGVILMHTPDELPPEWIKEMKIQKKANGTRKDPYYTDPVSGYVFRSLKDALRYVETRDPKKCAIKPKKREELEFLNEENTLPSAAIITNLITMDAEDSQKTSVSADDMITSSLTAEILEGKQSLDNVIEKCADTKENYDPSSSPVQRTEGSKSSRGKEECAGDGTVSTPSTEILRDENLEENGAEKNSHRKTQIRSSKLKSKRALGLPCRSSSRLAGLKPEMVANLGLSEHALRAAARKCGGSEAKLCLGALDNVTHSSTQQFHTVSETEIADNALGVTEAPSNVELLNRSKKPLEDQAVPEGQPIRQETEKKDEETLESQLGDPFGDPWSDPSERAFETFLGEIPVDDTLLCDTSHAQSDGCLALPEIGEPPFFPSYFSYNFDAPGKPVSVPQLPTNPTSLPPGNFSLPSCTASAPQPPNFEGNKEHQPKVNS